MKLGFIGSGKMASALVKGVLQAGICNPGDITISDTYGEAATKLAGATGVRAVDANRRVVDSSDVIVLAVKPGDAIDLLKELSSGAGDSGSKLLISIAAGLTLERLENAAGSGFRVVRVMPNTPALILQGAAAFASGSKATSEDDALTRRIFEAAGVVAKVKEELLDAVTGLSGSGPAYIYTVIEALADGGVLMGLPRELALQLAAKTVAGAAGMVLQSGEHPAQLRDQVTSPGGTTIAGLEALENSGLRSALIHAVRAATERSYELRQS